MITVKVMVVGSATCGKTSLVRRFVDSEFPTSPAPTVYENYASHLEIKGKEVKLILTDTSDSEEYDRCRYSSYASADVVLLCFSVRDIFFSSEVPKKWAREIRHGGRTTPFLLVATQTDLRKDEQIIQELAHLKYKPVTEKEGAAMAYRIGAQAYLECSALTGDGVAKVFQEAVKRALKAKEPKKKRKLLLCF